MKNLHLSILLIDQAAQLLPQVLLLIVRYPAAEQAVAVSKGVSPSQLTATFERSSEPTWCTGNMCRLLTPCLASASSAY